MLTLGIGLRLDQPQPMSSAAPAAHAYWRVSCLYADDPGYTGMATLEMRTSIGGAQAATGGTVSASSEQGSYPASAAIDANGATFWATNAVPALLDARPWIKYAFAAPVALAELGITARNDADCDQTPRIFALEYSDDNAAWTTSDVFVTTAWTAGASRSFAVGAGAWSGAKRFWRLKLTNASDYMSFAELEFRGSVGGASLCTGGTPFVTGSTQVYSGPLSYGFDGNTATDVYLNNNAATRYVGYAFASVPGTVAQVMYQARNGTPWYQQAPIGADSLVVQSSSDGATWSDEGTFTPATWTTSAQIQTFTL